MIKTIAIIGRPNVGKSTLFNTLINRGEALVSSNPGLTRDRTYSYFLPQDNLKYLLIDTGGFILDTDKPLILKVNLQVDIAIDQADLLLFVVDTKDGLVPMDEKIAQKLRKTLKPVILVVNKSDTPEKDIHSGDFCKLGFEELIPISAKLKRNISGIIDRITDALPDSFKDEKPDKYLTLCVAGKPNVGKSTLVNRLAGEQRVIVDEEPGTTRNPAKCYIQINNRQWEVVDLAGLWRKTRGKEVEEIISMLAARKEIERANACIFLLDLTEQLSFQDSRIASWIIESGTPVIMAGNKKDLIDETKDMDESYHAGLVRQMPFMNFAAFIMISAKDGTGVKKIYRELDRIMKNSFKEIPQEELDLLLKKILIKRRPPKAANIRPQVLKLYQEGINPPVFKMLIGHHRLDKIPRHWINYVKNSIYKEFDYYGVPLTLKMKQRKIRVKGRTR